MSTYELRRKTGENTTELLVLSSDCVDTSKFTSAIYVVGDTTGTSPAWTATSNDITSYKDGMMIMFKIGIAGVSGTQTTLNINNLGAKKVYENNTTNPSTHYVVGAVLFMVYDSTADSNNGAWKIAADRTISDSQNVRTYNYSDTDYDRDLLARQDTGAITSGSYTAKYVATTSHAKVNTKTGKITSDSGFAVTNGTSAQFLKADGSTDGNSYVTSDTFTTELAKKVNDMTIGLYNGTGGNPKPVKFMSVNYTNCTSEAGVFIKISMVSGHGNGVSYVFLQDAFFNVSYTGNVSVNVYKYFGANTTYNGVDRQYGDIFWVIDTTNKVVDFYTLMGQYSTAYSSPFKRLNSSSNGVITQYTSATVYSSGTQNFATQGDIVRKSDVDATPTQNSSNLITSGAVYSAIFTALNTPV